MGKRMAAKLQEVRAKLQQRLHESPADAIEWLQSLVGGYFQYHAIPGNEVRLRAFRHDVLRLWMRQLRRRSQRSRWTWERFLERLGVLMP
jgi:RNA-directed DNA polymerase